VTPEPRPAAARRVSLVRVGFVLSVAALIAGGAVDDGSPDVRRKARRRLPYVDVTPRPRRTSRIRRQPASHVISGSSWPIRRTLRALVGDLLHARCGARADLDRRLVRLREIGGDATVFQKPSTMSWRRCFDTGS
jgi:hypothetical protein